APPIASSEEPFATPTPPNAASTETQPTASSGVLSVLLGSFSGWRWTNRRGLGVVVRLLRNMLKYVGQLPSLAALGTTVQLSSASFAVTIGLALPVIQISAPRWPPWPRLASIARSASCGVQMR